MPRRPLGLTVIEIAIVLTIVGFVAAFVWPAWRDHTTRARVAEVIAAAAPAQAVIEEYAAAHGALPASDAVALPFITAPQVLTSTWAAAGATGTVTVSTRPATVRDDAALDARAVVLTATFDPRARSVRWVCGGTPATTVDPRFLPDDCR